MQPSLPKSVWVRSEGGHEAFELAEVVGERTDGTVRVRISSWAGAKDRIIRLGVDSWPANPESREVAADLTSLEEKHPVCGQPSALQTTQSCPAQTLPLANNLQTHLVQAALLHSVSVRYGRADFFTNVGPDCLVWISPGGPVAELWGDKRMRQAAEGDEQPHAYTLAERSLGRASRPNGRPQSISLQGESGTAQLGLSFELMRYWLWRTLPPAISGSTNGTSGSAGPDLREFDTAVKLLGSGDIALQALGCARTRRISSSARFGRLMQGGLDAAGGAASVSLQPFGVERSRVVKAAGRAAESQQQ